MSEKSEIASEAVMTPRAEAQSLVHAAAGAEGSVKERLRRATRAFSAIKPTRVRDLYYADPRARVRADELAYLRDRLAARRAERQSSEAHAEAPAGDYAALLARIERLESLFRADPDFYGPQREALRQMASRR